MILSMGEELKVFTDEGTESIPEVSRAKVAGEWNLHGSIETCVSST